MCQRYSWRQNPKSILHTPNHLNNEYYRDTGTQVPSRRSHTADQCSNVFTPHTTPPTPFVSLDISYHDRIQPCHGMGILPVAVGTVVVMMLEVIVPI